MRFATFLSFRRIRISAWMYYASLLAKMRYSSVIARLKREYVLMHELGAILSYRRSQMIYDFAVLGSRDRIYLHAINSSDFIVAWQVFVRKEYWRAVTWCREATKDKQGDIWIVDAGANIGLTTLYFLRTIKCAKILAIEPDSENYIRMLKNISTSISDRCVFVNAALWTSGERLEVSSLYGDRMEHARRVLPSEQGRVSGVTLEGLLKLHKISYIDILKIDIEGSEYELFKSRDFIKLVKSLVGVLAIEIHNDLGLPDEILSHFPRNEYEVVLDCQTHFIRKYPA